MKPSFALNLSPDGISLLHRTGRGWIVVGEVPLDTPDLGEAMAYLRSTALGLEPRGLTTKLILPGSQILYRVIEAPGPSVAKRREQIAAALEGVTPYPVVDLAFAWSGTGTTVQVAVVARETLQEAEHFALEHRFNPVSFVAIPEPLNFAGEPFFGQTEAAPALLAGNTFERDQEPVRIVGRASLPSSSDGPVAGNAPPPPYEDPRPKVPATPAPEHAKDEAPNVVLADRAPVAKETEPETEVPAADDDPPEETGDALIRAAPVSDLRPPAGDDAVHKAPFVEAPFVEAVDEDDTPIAPAPVSDLRGPGSFAKAAHPRVSVTEPVIPPDDVPAADVATTPPATARAEITAEPAFSSRRNGAQADRRAGPAEAAADSTAPPAAPRPHLTPMPESVKAALAAQQTKRKATPGRPTQPRMPPPLTAPQTKAAPKAPEQPTYTRFLPETPTDTPPEIDPLGTAALPRPGAVAPPPVPAPPNVPRPTTEAEAMTVFGARKAEPRGASLRVGLILTLILLILIAAVVAWSAMQSSTQPAGAQVNGAVTVPKSGTTAAASQEIEGNISPAAPAAMAPTAGTETAATPVPSSPATTAGQKTAAAAAPVAAVTATVSNTAPTVTLKAAVPEQAPGPGASPSEITLASVDPRLLSAPRPGISVRRPNGHDAAPQVTPPPMPQPGAAAETAAASHATPVTAQANAQTAAAPVAGVTDPVPKPRPVAGALLPFIRPQGRPTTSAFANAAAPAAPTTMADAASATLGASPADLVSPLAVAASPRPERLPKQLLALRKAASRQASGGMNKSVNDAVASALAGNAQTGQGPAAKPAPPSTMPALPSKPSVVKEATIVGAINLNRINLLGVFGTADNRTALVRLSSGRVKKVHVGDVLDGGRVAAIGESMLYYVKNGRNVQLTLPQG